jgi:hypothetical protein
MFRNALFASVIALGAAGAAGAAHAQAPDVSTGHVPAAAGNVVGGGVASIAGGGEDRVITYADVGAGAGQTVLAQPPRLARARNINGSLSVEYLQPETARPGREAWLVGGGDEAQVVYRNPH